MSQLGLLGVVFMACLTGCATQPPAPYRTFSEPVTPRKDPSKSTDPADIYLQLGLDALATLPDPPATTNSPGYKDVTRRKAEPLLDRLAKASAKHVDLVVRARGIGESLDVEAGWARLGHAIAYTIDNALDTGDTRSAVKWTLVAHNFGFDLTSGDIVQAQAGLSIADMARGVLAPEMGKLSAEDLQILASGLTASIARLTPEQKTLANERLNSLAVIQALQDKYRTKGGLDDLEKKAYSDTREAWAYLRRMPDSERPRYFDGLDSEVEDSLQLAKRFCDMHQSERDPALAAQAKALTAIKYRPWKRLIPQYFNTWPLYLDQYDLTLTRTRLFALTAMVDEGIKTNGVAPDVMATAPDSVKIDPYSGRPLGYAHASTDFKLYSVGADGKDDAGDTDEAGLYPDVRLIGATAVGT